MGLLIWLGLIGCSSEAKHTIEDFCKKNFYQTELQKACSDGVKISDKGVFGDGYAKKNCDMYLRRANGVEKAIACFSGYKEHENRKNGGASIQKYEINDEVMVSLPKEEKVQQSESYESQSSFSREI